eukprot:CAMPEP_0184872370 /NCGR_PEP_ID=MMETSP0580-20130426/41255_1 /TAXON_ID=1118495 /ORGANISM="Dactyliosolen fragilissimus" /LENGTH=491 /DNA_ID=CAMNT_0027375165 /DNA_START=406 /DNA_END=1881 /DNA_ORIENTATION=+
MTSIHSSSIGEHSSVNGEHDRDNIKDEDVCVQTRQDRKGSTDEMEIDSQNKTIDTSKHDDDAEGNVVTVVTKAKRAAASLWMLIHAQTCNLRAESCPHKGCSETKRLLLHLKTCPATNPDSKCLTGYHGCYQARKLLHHHQRCREIRARQRQSRSNKHQPHFCLVCSLMARHARSVLEGTKITEEAQTLINMKTKNQSNVDLPNSLSTSPSHGFATSDTSTAYQGTQPSNQISSQFPTSNQNLNLLAESATFLQDSILNNVKQRKATLPRCSSQSMMPPPPPRPRSSSENFKGSSINTTSTAPNRILPFTFSDNGGKPIIRSNTYTNQYKVITPELGSPPSNPEFMEEDDNKPITNINLPRYISENTNFDIKHFEAISRSPMVARKKSNLRRIRAGSLDDRKKKTAHCVSRDKVVPSRSNPDFFKDKFASELLSDYGVVVNEEEKDSQVEIDNNRIDQLHKVLSRQRSVSCSILCDNTQIGDIQENHHKKL